MFGPLTMNQFAFPVHRSCRISIVIGSLLSFPIPPLAQVLPPDAMAAMLASQQANMGAAESLRMSKSIGVPMAKAAPLSDIPDGKGSAESVPGFPANPKAVRAPALHRAGQR